MRHTPNIGGGETGDFQIRFLQLCEEKRIGIGGTWGLCIAGCLGRWDVPAPFTMQPGFFLQILSGRAFHPPVSGNSCEFIFLCYDFYSAIFFCIAFQNPRRIVRRAVIYADNFRFFPRLAAYAVQALFQILFFIVYWYDN